MRKKLVALLLAVLLIALFMWSKDQSYLEFSVAKGDSGKFSYNILNQNNQRVIDISNSSNHLKKRVAASTYQVVVKNGGGSYFTVVKTHGFFGKTTINAELLPEKERMFVGNNPGSCMNYIGSVLISYTCGDLLSNALIHEPATRRQPSYTHRSNVGGATGGVDDRVNGYVEGVIPSKVSGVQNEVFALIRSSAYSESGASQMIVSLGNNLAVKDKVDLTDLDPTKTYNIKPYKEGFLVYENLLTTGYYYTAMVAKPIKMDLQKQQDPKLLPLSLDTISDNILTLYSQDAVSSTKSPTSEIIQSSAASTKHFKIKGIYSVARFCGENKVCVLGSRGLEVFDSSSDKLVQKFSVMGVNDFRVTNNGVVALTKSGALSINTSSGAGFVEYDFGDYGYLGIQEYNNSYVLGLSDPRGDKVALLLDESTANTDSIDKKILDIKKLAGVATATSYGNYVFISPNLGPLEYNSQTKSFGYNPSTKKIINDKIDEGIKSLGISNKYIIVNLLR